MDLNAYIREHAVIGLRNLSHVYLLKQKKQEDTDSIKNYLSFPKDKNDEWSRVLSERKELRFWIDEHLESLFIGHEVFLFNGTYYKIPVNQLNAMYGINGYEVTFIEMTEDELKQHLSK